MGDHIALSCAAAAKPLERFHGGLMMLFDPDEKDVIGVDACEDAGGRE